MATRFVTLVLFALPLLANASINKVTRSPSPGLLDSLASPVNGVTDNTLESAQAAGVPDLGTKKVTKDVTKTDSFTAPVKDVVGLLGAGNTGIVKRNNSSCRRKKGSV